MPPARLIFSTGSLYILDLAYVFELIADAGFDGVEVMCDERYSTRDPHYLSRLKERHGLPILALHTPFSPRTPGWRDPHSEVARITHTLALAETVGAEVIVVHVPRKHGEATLRLGGRTLRFPWPSPDRAVKRWIEGDLAAAQARTRVKIALENMPARQIAGQPLDATWWNEIDTWSQVHDHLTLDTTHWATKRINPLDAYHAAGARVAHVHLSNYNGHEHQLPHKGNLNLRAFLRALAADGFAGTVSLELTPHVLNYKDERGLRRIIGECLNFCREHLA